jgi:hypothetical protein
MIPLIEFTQKISTTEGFKTTKIKININYIVAFHEIFYDESCKSVICCPQENFYVCETIDEIDYKIEHYLSERQYKEAIAGAI